MDRRSGKSVKWAVFWRKGENGLPGRRHCLIVARNVLTGEVKYFVANRVPGEKGTTLRWLLRVAFGRWSVEHCFRDAKDELGFDHYQVRGWRCVHRHFFVTQLSYLFCARVRQQYDAPADEQFDRLSVEQVRSAMNTWLSAVDVPPKTRRERYEEELWKQRYYQRRNKQSRKSHTKTRIARLEAIGIDVDRIKRPQRRPIVFLAHDLQQQIVPKWRCPTKGVLLANTTHQGISLAAGERGDVRGHVRAGRNWS